MTISVFVKNYILKTRTCLLKIRKCSLKDIKKNPGPNILGNFHVFGIMDSLTSHNYA